MIKLFASFVFLALCVGVVSLAHGSHVNVGVPIGAFLYCETPESAENALTLLLASKDAKTAELSHAYVDFVGDPDVPCFDTRSMGISQFGSVPIERMDQYVRVTENAVFTLWKVDLNGTVQYTWEGDLLPQV